MNGSSRSLPAGNGASISNDSRQFVSYSHHFALELLVDPDIWRRPGHLSVFRAPEVAFGSVESVLVIPKRRKTMLVILSFAIGAFDICTVSRYGLAVRNQSSQR